MITQHQLIDWGTEAVVVCSLLHSFLPPWDFLKDFPTAQKYYKLTVYIIGYVALNGRSTVYRSLSVNGNGSNGNGSSSVATNTTTNGGNK